MENHWQFVSISLCSYQYSTLFPPPPPPPPTLWCSAGCRQHHWKGGLSPPRTFHCLLPPVCYPLSVAPCLLPPLCCPLSVAHCLSVAPCLLPTVCCPLSVTPCLLPTVCYPLPQTFPCSCVKSLYFVLSKNVIRITQGNFDRCCSARGLWPLLALQQCEGAVATASTTAVRGGCGHC